MADTPPVVPEHESWDSEYELREKKQRRKKIIIGVIAAVAFVASLYGYDVYNMYVGKKASKPSRKMQESARVALEKENVALRAHALKEAEAKLNEGRPEEAKVILMKYLSRDPQNAEVHYQIGKVFLRQGQMQGAFDYSRQATMLKPDYGEALYQLGNIYILDRNILAAKDTSPKLQRVPGFAWQAALLDSQIALGENKIDLAISKAMESEKLSPKPLDVKGTVYLADLYIKKGNRAAAEALVSKHPQENLDVDDLLSLAKFYLRLKNNARTEAYFQEALKRYPRNPEVLYTYGDYLFASGKFPEAIAYYKKTMEIVPNLPVLEYNIGRVLLTSGKHSELKKHVDTMLVQDPRNLLALRLKAQLALAQGQRQEAIDTMEKVTGLLPYSPVPRVLLASLHLQEGNLSLAAENALKAVSLGDRSVAPQTIMASVYGKRGQYPEAKAALEAILAADPYNLPALMQLGDTYVSMGQYKQAEEQYAKVVAKYPNLKELKARTIWLKTVEGKGSEALTASRKYWREMPDDMTALGAYLNTLIANNRTDEAISVAMIQAQKRPNDWRIPFLLGDMYLLNANKPAALASYQRALSLNPDDVNLIMNLSSRYTRAGMKEESEKMLLMTYAKDPRNILIANQLAWLYIETYKAPERARNIVEFLRQGAKESAVLDTVGWYYYKTKDYRSASYYLTEASRLAPENRVIKEHLALTLKQVNSK